MNIVGYFEPSHAHDIGLCTSSKKTFRPGLHMMYTRKPKKNSLYIRLLITDAKVTVDYLFWCKALLRDTVFREDVMPYSSKTEARSH